MSLDKVERFPNGWAVRREDGTIKTILGVHKNQPEVVARCKAVILSKTLDLSPKKDKKHVCNRSLSSPPSIVFSIRRRHRGMAAEPGREFSIHVSVQLALLSYMNDSNQRATRWYKIPIGEMRDLTDEALAKASKAVYGAWAWATYNRRTRQVSDLLHLDLPKNLSAWYEHLENIPPFFTKDQVWRRYGFHPETGTDIVARRHL